jgi:transposase
MWIAAFWQPSAVDFTTTILSPSRLPSALLDAAYPASTAIKLILDNHSAHISRETRAWLDTRPPGRFDFTFTPKHGSWLNLIEGFFSKFARSVLRHIRVTSKHELKQRIMAGIDDVNRHPVIHTWSYKLAEAA